ncbi:glycyl-tRNA synthetase subunit beta [Rhodobacterales bacterium HTCC2150]|nr:glycyl-tRNA synthetase subunit beta [Rhodobacterales bacterium HTCC2150] [Rhodobacteraceae bacterium HTCC2150]
MFIGMNWGGLTDGFENHGTNTYAALQLEHRHFI